MTSRERKREFMSKEKGNGKVALLASKVKGVVTEVTSHWKKPARGKYVSYKEVLNYSIGGMGWNCVMYVLSFLGLGAANTLIGSTIGIRPMHLQIMAAIQSFVGIVFPIIRGKMVDNTRTKYGRFRPYIALTGLPLLIMCAVYIWLPFESMPYRNKLIATFFFTLAIGFVTPLFTDTYGELGSCLTPNTAERTNIFAISSIIYSFAPTVYYALVPMLSTLTGGFTDIRTYKYIIVPVGIIGVGLSLFTAFGCKERVVTSKNYVQKVGLIEGVTAIYKNKYWWIRTVATLVGFLEGAAGVIFGWIYIYSTQDMITFGILNTIWGTASGLSMMLTPWILAKLGNRRTLLMHNGLNIVFSVFMLMTFKMPGVYFVFMYLNTFVNQLQIVYNPVLNSEVKDSIQYSSGKRMDFTLGAAWAIMAPIQIITGFAIPYIYEMMGLTVNYDVLYDPVVRNDLFAVLCFCAIIGAALNLIPFFFYKLSREKHKMIILALKYRAINADYASGNVSCYQIRDAVDMYNLAETMHAKPDYDIKALKREYLAIMRSKAVTEEMKASAEWNDKEARKALVKSAKADKKERARAAFKAYRDAEEVMNYKEAYDEIIVPEYSKYECPLGKVKLEVSRIISAIELDGIKTTSIDLSSIRWDKGDVKVDKKIEKYLAKVQKSYEKMQALANKKYGNARLENTYWDDLQRALDLPTGTIEEKKHHDREVVKYEKIYSRFQKEFKCWNRAIEYVNEYEQSFNFERYIVGQYDDACKECMAKDREQDLKDARERAEHKVELERIRIERANKKRQKKGLEPLPLPSYDDIEIELPEYDEKDAIDEPVDNNSNAIDETSVETIESVEREVTAEEAQDEKID